MRRVVAVALVAVSMGMPRVGGSAWAGSRMTPLRVAMETGDGNVNVNIVVRQVSFTPAVAHVGDTIRIETVIEDVDEGYTSIPSRILANGKPVAGGLFTFGFSKGNRVYKETFEWNTTGAVPGEYRIRADYYLREDSSPFDNEMTVKQPLILLPAGAPFPEGKSGGGTVTEKDPRWGQMRIGG